MQRRCLALDAILTELVDLLCLLSKPLLVGGGDVVGGGLVPVEPVGTDTGVPQCQPPLVLHTVTLIFVGSAEMLVL